MARRVAVMQPYFFPYLGYFALIDQVDDWVFFDTAQYIRRGWIHRNRVLSTSTEGWAYVGVPVRRQRRSARICDVLAVEDPAWKTDLVRKLEFYRVRRAPFYEPVRAWLLEVLDEDFTGISDWAIHSVECTCELLGLALGTEIFSRWPGQDWKAPAADEWGLAITRHLGGTEYVNLPGGRAFFDPAKYREVGIELRFLETTGLQYPQGSTSPVENLSVIDALMWLEPERVRDLLRSVRLVEP